MNVPFSGRIRPLPVAVAVLAALVLLVVGIRLVPGGGTQVATQGAGAITQFADDFSSRAGWATFSSKTSALGYSEDGYLLNLKRRADDAVSTLVLPGNALSSVAATTVVVERSAFGGLAGVGCIDGNQRGYLGAVDPAGSGFVILRVNGRAMDLLRYGANDEGAIREVNEENELQIQCSVRTGAESRTVVRLFANRRLLAAYEDSAGFGPFKGVALGGVSLRHPLEAVFKRVSLQMLPTPQGDTPLVTACERLGAATSVENDYRWLVDSGATSLNSPDFDSRQVVRIARELSRLSAGLGADGRTAGAPEARGALQTLAARLRQQSDAMNALTNAVNRGPVDTAGPSAALSCAKPRASRPPWDASGRLGLVPPRAVAGRKSPGARELDRRLIRDLPAPDFIADDTPPLRSDVHVDVDLTYHSFRVFGASLAELNRSLRVNAIRVEGEHAAGVTDSRFEWTYQPIDRPDGCALVPGVTLTLRITLPDWRPPVDADRSLRHQWNQFMWDLDDHERHHAELWIKAANRMIVAINGVPPDPSCSRVVAAAKARVAQVFRTYDRRQRAFDRDVASGKLPGPSLP